MFNGKATIKFSTQPVQNTVIMKVTATILIKLISQAVMSLSKSTTFSRHGTKVLIVNCFHFSYI